MTMRTREYCNLKRFLSSTRVSFAFAVALVRAASSKSAMAPIVKTLRENTQERRLKKTDAWGLVSRGFVPACVRRAASFSRAPCGERSHVNSFFQ